MIAPPALHLITPRIVIATDQSSSITNLFSKFKSDEFTCATVTSRHSNRFHMEEETAPLQPGGAEEPPAKRARGKSKEQKEFDAAHDYTTIQAKLSKFLQPEFAPVVGDLLAATADTISTIALEGYQLANLHVCRLLSDGQALPKLDQTFFYQCCALVCDSTKISNEELVSTAEVYQNLRPEGWTVPCSENLTRAMGSLARDMATATENHIVMNTYDRLVRYVSFCYLEAHNLSQARTFIRSCFKDPESHLTDDQKEFKQWIEFDPFFQQNVENNINHFISKLAQVLQVYESFPAGTRHVRTFTLLPQKGDYVPQFFLVDKSTLPDMLNRLDISTQQDIVRSMLDRFPAQGSDFRTFLEIRLKAPKAVFTQGFQNQKEIADALWATLFKSSKYETATRRFASKISTNGYAVTVYLQKPRGPAAPPRRKGKKNNDDDDEYDSPKDVKKEDFDTFYGIDPGKTYVGTAFGGQEENGRSKCSQVSRREMHHNAKMNEHRAWNKEFRERNPTYSAAIGTLDSLKTANYETMQNRLRSTLSLAMPILAHSRRKVFRAWRFKVSRFDKKALHKAIKKLIGPNAVEKRTLIGFGDWSQPQGFKGGATAPVKKLRRAMRRTGLKVLKIDEFRTSKCCSKCCCTAGIVANVSYGEGQARKQCHQVVRCGNSECEVYWQRDVNASRNIRTLLMALMNGQKRPARMERRRR